MAIIKCEKCAFTMQSAQAFDKSIPDARGESLACPECGNATFYRKSGPKHTTYENGFVIHHK